MDPPSPTRLAHQPTIREKTTTISKNHRASRPAVREAFLLLLKPGGTSVLAHAFSFMMPGLLQTTTVGETLLRATGSRPCWHNRSRKSSTPSRWYVPHRTASTKVSANNDYRRWRYTSSRNHTPISSNDYASIIWTWRLGEYLPTKAPGRLAAV